MDFLKLETISKLLGSWPLLFSLMFVSTGLWWLPEGWLTDPAVVKARDQYIGIIGLTAIASWLLLIAKIIIFVYQKFPEYLKKFKESKSQKQNREIHKRRTLKNLQYLKPSLKTFLLSRKESNEQKFQFGPSDQNIMGPLHNACILNITHHFNDIWEVEIKDWVWDKIDQDLLYPIDALPKPHNT